MKSRGMPWYAFGLANLVIVTVLSLGFWYLLVDPTTAIVTSYPQPFNEMLFWSILMAVFLGFNLELHYFEKLRQPLRGFVATAITLALGIAITYAFVWWGTYDPAFSKTVPMGNGYFLPALFVLFGFFTYLTSVINWEHWPWKDKGLSQPWVGIAQIGTITGPTVVVYAIFALPNLASWADPNNVILDVNTQIGVVYSVIVVSIVTGLLLENWPWRLAGGGGRTALASLVGNIVIGVVLYFVLRAIARLILGSDISAALGTGLNQFPAQIGVCWVFWMILCDNVFDSRPTGLGTAANYVGRVVWTLVAGIVTFVLYYYVIAQHVLHEPGVLDEALKNPVGEIHGNALGWMDWMVLWILVYVVYFESFGLPKLANPTAPGAVEEEPAQHEESARP